MKKNTFEIEGVGTVMFRRSKRARNLNIYITVLKGVRVTIPYRVSVKEAKEFADSKSDWIKKHLAKMKKSERKFVIIDSANINKAEAKKILIDRLNELAAKHRFKYNRVFIKTAKTQWGSCSAKNNINLNIRLVKLPDKLIDYVILHELVHIDEKNHSKKFWNKLTKILSNAKSLNSRLNKYHLEHYQMEIF